MNKVSPKTLLNSKWTKVQVENKEKHFVIVEVEYDDTSTVIHCLIEAVMTKHCLSIDWRELKQPTLWKIGWQ